MRWNARHSRRVGSGGQFSLVANVPNGSLAKNDGSPPREKEGAAGNDKRSSGFHTLIVLLVAFLSAGGCLTVKPMKLPPQLSAHLKSYTKVRHDLMSVWIDSEVQLDKGDFVQVAVSGKGSGMYRDRNRHDMEPCIHLWGRIGKEGNVFQFIKPDNTGEFLVQNDKKPGTFFIGLKWIYWDIKGRPTRNSDYYKYNEGKFDLDILVWKKDDPEMILSALEKTCKTYPDNRNLKRLLAKQERKVASILLNRKQGHEEAFQLLLQSNVKLQATKKMSDSDLYALAKNYYCLYRLAKITSSRKGKKTQPALFRRKAIDAVCLALKDQPFLAKLHEDEAETLFLLQAILRTSSRHFRVGLRIGAWHFVI